MQRQYCTLDEAIGQVLEQWGPEAFLDPKRVFFWLARVMDPDSWELHVISVWCDATLLRPYADAMADERESLHHAVVLACRRIVEGGYIPSCAELVADGIAKGIARWRGDDCSVPGGYYTLAERR